MPFPLSEWWFWVFVAPEAVLLAGWLIFLIVAGVGFGAAAAWRKMGGRDDE